MKGLSLQQLDAALRAAGHGPTQGDDHVIFENQINRIFERYGDDYYVEHDPCNDPWELCIENPVWDEARKNGSIGIRKGYKVK